MRNTLNAKKMLTIVGILPVVLMTATLAVRPSLSQQAAAPQAPKVVAPADGPRVDRETARKQLKDNMAAQITEFMKLHNDARAEVGVPALVWDPELAKYAQEWADHLVANGGTLEHRTDNKYGENLAAYMPEAGKRPAYGAKLWYDEIQNYDAVNNKSSNGKVIGHYTQMVWRKSTKVGFGIAMGDDGMAILCANYEVAGNFNNERPYN